MRLLPLIPLLSVLVCCSPAKKIDELNAQFAKDYQQLPRYDSLPTRRLSWKEALSMLERNNIEYRESKRAYDNAKYQIGSTWRSLIPILDSGYFYNAPLKWDKGTPAQHNFNINIIFNLPSLVTMPVEHYTNALAAIKANVDCQLKQRELEARLWQCFREHSIMEQEQALYEQSPGQDAAAKQRLRDLYQQKQRALWSRLCVLINDHSARWLPQCAGLPEPSLQHFRQKAKAPDELFISTLSLQAEASRLKKLGIFLQFMPMVYTDVYSPSLFTDTGGNNDGFMRNADDVRISFNTFLRLDTRLERYHDYKDADKAHQLTLEALSQAMMEHREKVLLTLNAWQKYEEWKESVDDYVAFRNRQEISDAEEAIARQQAHLEIEKARLEQRRSNLERECALMQEYGWRSQGDVPPVPDK